ASCRPRRSTRASHASPPRSSKPGATDLRGALRATASRRTTENDLDCARGRRQHPRDQPRLGWGGKDGFGHAERRARAVALKRAETVGTEVAVVAGELSLVHLPRMKRSRVGEERLGIL